MKIEKFKKLKKFALVRSGEVIERIKSFEYDCGEICAVNLLDADELYPDDLEENIFEVGDEIFVDGQRVKVVAINEGIIVDSEPTYTYEAKDGKHHIRSYIDADNGYLTFYVPRKTTLKSSFERMDIVKNVCEVLDEADYPYEENVVISICDEWWNKKKDLINLLRKHPDWDEKSMCIKGKVNEIRSKDDNLFVNACKKLYHNCRENGMYLSDEQLDIMWDGVQCTPPSKFVNEAIQSRYAALGVDMKVGAKYSRELNKIFISMGLDKYPNYNHDFAVIADAINPMDNSQTAILSVNPCDFLKMSYGEKWSSCHNIRERGCYHAGTQSYIMDGSSMIFYTISNSYSGEPWENPKLTRQIYCYENGAFLQSRNYPNHNLAARDEEYTKFVSEVLSTCLKIDNKFHSVSNSQYLYTDPTSLHYPDYNYLEYNTHTYVFDSLDNIEHAVIHIGAPSWCLECGEVLQDHESMICPKCCGDDEEESHQNAFLECRTCGMRFCASDPYNYSGYNDEDGNVYCHCHHTKCDYCHTTFFGNGVRRKVVELEGGKHICAGCMEEKGLVMCSRCGQPHEKSKCVEYTMKDGTKKYLCETCRQYSLERFIDICPECGGLYVNYSEDSKQYHKYCERCRGAISCGDTVRINKFDEIYISCDSWLNGVFPGFKLLSGEMVAEYEARNELITGTSILVGKYYPEFRDYISVIDVGNGFVAVVTHDHIERI